MALKIKSGKGGWGRVQRLPSKALGGTGCSAPLPCCCSLLGFVVAPVVRLVPVVSFVAACVWLFFEVLHAICRMQATTSLFRSPRGFCGQ